jgi:hypothetical protein
MSILYAATITSMPVSQARITNRFSSSMPELESTILGDVANNLSTSTASTTELASKDQSDGSNGLTNTILILGSIIAFSAILYYNYQNNQNMKHLNIRRAS